MESNTTWSPSDTELREGPGLIASTVYINFIKSRRMVAYHVTDASSAPVPVFTVGIPRLIWIRKVISTVQIIVINVFQNRHLRLVFRNFD